MEASGSNRVLFEALLSKVRMSPAPHGAHACTHRAVMLHGALLRPAAMHAQHACRARRCRWFAGMRAQTPSSTTQLR
jgi:hypothetical protein